MKIRLFLSRSCVAALFCALSLLFSNSAAHAGWVELTYDDFENGFGNWTDGGNDCSLYSGGTHAHQGTSAANIQDDRGEMSSFYLTNPLDLTGFRSVKIEFWYKPVSMEAGEDFRVQYFDGTSWQVVESWASGAEFTNGSFYYEVVALSDAEYVFPANASFRIECDASGNGDDVYVDEVRISTSTDRIAVSVNGTVPDHGDSTIAGSLARLISLYASDATVTGFDLVDDAQYNIESTISLPNGKHLSGIRNSSQSLRAGSGLSDGTMLVLGSDTGLSSLLLNGAYQARRIVDALGVSNVVIEDIDIRNTKNDYTAAPASGKAGGPTLVDVSGSTNVTIQNADIRNAGYPKSNPSANFGSYGILALSCSNLLVDNIYLIYTLTCGIDFTGSRYVTIQNSSIRQTGINAGYGAGAVADGLTAYHAWPVGGLADYHIENNLIDWYRNHGIHVGGIGITVKGNTIYRNYAGNFGLNAIHIGDFRMDSGSIGPYGLPNVSSGVKVIDNYCEYGFGAWLYPIAFMNVKDTEDYLIYGNTMDGAGTPADMNFADPRPTLMWQNQTTGDVDIWWMAYITGRTQDHSVPSPGLRYATELELSAVMPDFNDPNWKIVGRADIDNNAYMDLIWRNVVTGENHYTLMRDADADGVHDETATGARLPALSDVNWRMEAIADMDQNDYPDFIWRNPSSGQLYYWLMAADANGFGTVIQESRYIGGGLNNWKIVDVADLNHDGWQDFFWWNAASGGMGCWLMVDSDSDGVADEWTSISLPTNSESGVRPAYVHDFNGDSTVDIVFRNTVTGANYVWLLEDSNSDGYANEYQGVQSLPSRSTDWVMGTSWY